MDKEILSGLIAFGTTIVALYVKDVMDKKLAARKEEQEQLDTAKVYASPLLRDTVSLMYRLKEIFEDNGRFLSRRAPQNEYVQYMFRSTLYRLCAVLGWLRAANRGLKGIVVQDEDDYDKIKKAIRKFESSLGPSNDLNKSRINFLAEAWEMPTGKLNSDVVEDLAEDLQDLTWNEIETYNGGVEKKNKSSKASEAKEERIDFARQLPEEKQLELLEKIAKKIAAACKLEDIDLAPVIALKRRACILAISRRESWIYRDWQSAIGDMMLTDSRNTERRFEVIGFSRFEDAYLKHLEDGEADNRWLERVVRLFYDLNLSRSEVFDARASQLRKVFSAGVEMVQVLSGVGFGTIVDKKRWQEVVKFGPSQKSVPENAEEQAEEEEGKK